MTFEEILDQFPASSTRKSIERWYRPTRRPRPKSSAGCQAQAIGHWQEAGTRALQRSANVEATAYVVVTNLLRHCID